MMLVFCWPWTGGPSVTVVPFAAGLLAVAIAGMALKPTIPLRSLAWLFAVVGAAWLSGMGYRETGAGLVATAVACGVLMAIGRMARSQRSIPQALMVALVLAMFWHVLVAWMQFFHVEGAFHPLANLNFTPRPYGNLRQPNHLASFALIGLLAVWWRHQRGLDARSVTAILAALAYSGVALSGSRTGLLSSTVVALCLWFLLKRASRFERCVFLAGPLWVILIAFALPFVGMTPNPEITRDNASWSVRLIYWREAWNLALSHPLLGVGWGELARARFEQLPLQPGVHNTFHAHNLVLHLLAEVGFIGATAILAPVAWLLWRQRPWRVMHASTCDNSDLVWAWLVLSVVGLHSMVEYPLWYMPFLIPTAFAFGLIMTGGLGASGLRQSGPGLAAGAGALLLCTVLALVDYAGVSAAYGAKGRSVAALTPSPPTQATVLFQRYADRDLLMRTSLTPENAPQVLAATERLLSDGPNPFLLSRRLAALCELVRESKARRLAARFKVLFQEDYARFLLTQNPAALKRCGL